jgi:hypothetical protein
MLYRYKKMVTTRTLLKLMFNAGVPIEDSSFAKELEGLAASFSFQHIRSLHCSLSSDIF